MHKIICSDDTVIIVLFLHCLKAHATNLLKMYVMKWTLSRNSSYVELGNRHRWLERVNVLCIGLGVKRCKFICVPTQLSCMQTQYSRSYCCKEGTRTSNLGLQGLFLVSLIFVFISLVHFLYKLAFYSAFCLLFCNQ